MLKVLGTVVDNENNDRVVSATVKATDSKGKIIQVTTNGDGDFEFDKLDSGEWSFIAYHEKYFPGELLKKKLSADMNDFKIGLKPMVGPYDQETGQKFFNGLVAVFFGLIIVYVVLHILFPLNPEASKNAFFWTATPWRYIEILVWALAGILVNKIIVCGWYLRTQSFYRLGKIMHIAHLITTPLLVFVAVLILSLASLKITLTGGTEVTLDLSQLPILIAVSFILGTSPWPVWDFIERTAKKIVPDETNK